MLKKPVTSPLVRNRKVSFLLNEQENKALTKYCMKYKISNRSLFLRESVMRAVLSRLGDDHPTLFGENEMR